MANAPDFWWATPLVGVVGASIAGMAIAANRRIARMRATLDLIERIESSDHYRRLFRSFKELGKSNGAVLDRLKKPETEADKSLREDVLAYLNHYELIALGCKQGILDEAFYALWMRSQVVRDWHNSKEFIFSIREPTVPKGSVAAYIEFEGFSRRFETYNERGLRFQRFRGRAKQLLARWHSWRQAPGAKPPDTR